MMAFFSISAAIFAHTWLDKRGSTVVDGVGEVM